jgi:hypothetical protein
MLGGPAGQAHLWFGIGTDTGISKEVVPLLVERDGWMRVVVRRPEIEAEPIEATDPRGPTAALQPPLPRRT